MITKLRIHFGRYGVPDVVVSDNGPQFACKEFKQFATRWQFSHVTSSPRYPQSNGKVENAVKTAKQLMRKAIDDKADVYLAFLDYRNTPTEAMHTSPAQRMFARRTRTLLPMLPVFLQTEPAAQRETPEQLKSRKNKQARIYNRQSKKLATLQPGDVVRFKKPTATNNTQKWTLAKVRKPSGIRSYIVESDGATYRRNRRQLRSTPEHYDDDAGGDSRQQEPDNTRADNESAQLRAQDVTSPPRSVPPVAASPRRNEPPVNVHSPMNVPTSPRQSPRDVTVARSGRLVKQPIKFKDYNMT